MSELIRCVSKDAEALPGFAPSSVVSSKRLREDRSSVATTMPEKIRDETSWPEEVDHGVEQVCTDSSSEPDKDVLRGLEPKAADKK